MGKYNLGSATTNINGNMSKKEIYINSDEIGDICDDIKLQFDNIKSSLNTINLLLNTAVKNSVVSGSYADSFKGWAKKCSSQAITALERKKSLSDKYSSDAKKYAMSLLDARIAELENQISVMEK